MPGGHPSAPCSPRAAGVVCACLAAGALFAFGAPSAQAGRWFLLSCRQPSGQPAATDGWTATATGPLGAYSGASDTCAAGGALTVNSSGEAPQSAYAGPQWQFTAPGGSTIAGGTLTATLSAPHGQTWLGAPNDSYDGADVLVNCQYNLPCGSAGTLAGVFPIPDTGAAHIYATAVCVGGYEGATSCPATGGNDATLALSAAQIELYTPANPGGSGFGGAAIAGEARGTQPLTFTATDSAGPGVYLITLAAEGQRLYSATPDNNEGSCAASAIIAGVAAFTSSQPCRQIETVQVPVATSGLADGRHDLTVTVTDAAGDSSVVYDGQVSTHNAPVNISPPTIRNASRIVAGSVVEADAGSWSVPEGSGSLSEGLQWQDCNPVGESCRDIPGATGASYAPGASDVGDALRVLVTASDRDGLASTASRASAAVEAASPPGGSIAPEASGSVLANTANGSGASEQASMHLDGPARISRTVGHSALRLRGTLIRSSGLPIAGASVDVLEASGGVGERVLTRTRTTASGAFSVMIPSGASRVLTVAYRAFASDLAYAARASTAETVSAGVSLGISPLHTPPTGTIVLSGRVSGPVPHDGVIVELLVRYRGAWEPFRTPRTNSSGHFRVRYQFQGAVGRFPFRAEVPSGQAGYPYVDGRSATVTVSSG